MTIPYLGPAAHTTPGNNLPIHRIVIHGTVSPCIKGGARNVARYFRGQSAGGSAHFVVDPGEVVRVVKDGTIAWHAPPNQHSLGIELCDPQDGPTVRWQDANHQSMLERAAVLTADLCKKHDIPIRRISIDDLRAGKEGICGHADVARAFNQSTHTDPGAGFPWTHFISMVEAAAHPKPKPFKPTAKPLTLWLHMPKGPQHTHWTKVAQKALGIPETGVFDHFMRRHVMAYRKRNKLGRPLGRIGPRMWRKLGVK